MKKLIDALLDKGYDWGFIHTFLNARDICYIYIPSIDFFEISTQLKAYSDLQKELIDQALIEVEFLRHV